MQAMTIELQATPSESCGKSLPVKAVFGTLGAGQGLTGQGRAAPIGRRCRFLWPCTRRKTEVWMRISLVAAAILFSSRSPI